jgi:MFS transporter, UMF1 family
MQTASKKVVTGWAMYDWANSVYSLVITSTIFPAYYEGLTSGKVITFFGRQYKEPSALYNYAVAFSFLFIALISPLLSSIADSKGNKKRFMQFFCYMGALSCCGMYFFTEDNIQVGLILFIIAAIGFCGSIVFYNSYLPEIAAVEDQDRVSAKGFSLGYIGSVILLILCLVLVMKHEMFGISSAGEASKISFVLTGLWWMGFAQITFARLPKSIAASHEKGKSFLAKGYTELRKVWNQLGHQPLLKRFLFSFLFISMGVQTVMYSAALFAKQQIFPDIPGDPEANKANGGKLIITILIIQIVAIAGAFIFSRLSKRFGNFKVLLFAVFVWIGICISAYFTYTEVQFYLLATAVGMVMGGIQSLCRSTYSKYMPETQDTASYFSFYDVCEKVGTVLGTLTFGIVTEQLGGMRNAVLFLMTYFIIALFLLMYAMVAKRKHDIGLKMKAIPVE